MGEIPLYVYKKRDALDYYNGDLLPDLLSVKYVGQDLSFFRYFLIS